MIHDGKRYTLGFYYRGTLCQLDTDYGVKPYHNYGHYHCVSIQFDTLPEAQNVLEKILGDSCLMPVEGCPWLMDNEKGVLVFEANK